MSKKFLIPYTWIFVVMLCHTSYGQYLGGIGDGLGLEATCNTDLDGSANTLTIGSISGSTVFCNNSAETFSINVTAGSAETYLWTGPTGMTVNSQQIDGYANLLFGSTSGTVTVEASNACATVFQNIAVSNAACTFFFGGSEDGVSTDASCNTTLDGVGAGLALSTISGSSIFCNNSAETYTVSVTTGAADNFFWTGPAGMTVNSQQIDGYANLLFGSTSGNVTVEASNACATVSQNIAVSNAACTFFFGGSEDGISTDASCNTTLDGVGAGLALSTITGSSVFCNNSAETYAVSVTTGAADNFFWTGPTGMTVNSQQIDGYANLLFGSTSGNVTVEASNACATVSQNIAVSNDACTFFFGGSEAGVSTDASCNTTLDGVGAGLALSTITGSSVFCNNSAETYAVTVTAGAADNFFWTGPTGMTVNSQQIDGYANLLFGSTSGNVTVEASNACATVSQNIAVSNDACTFFFGGSEAGVSTDASCNTTLDGVGAGLALSTITGSSVFCNNSSETYAVTVTAGAADNFFWTGPTGMTVNSQQIGGYANLLFGASSGTITVEASNACATVTENIAVSNAACTFFFGGSEDGVSIDASCNTTLDGVGTGLTISSITGPSNFCENNSETYEVTVTAGIADFFFWTGPSGFTILSQQIGGFVNMLFNASSGNISVEVSNDCAIVVENLAVSNTTCNLYNGGNGDGLAIGESDMSINLPITLISFSAYHENQQVVLKWVTATEVNNDYFTIERSIGLVNWVAIKTITGAGNSHEEIHYKTIDDKPLYGNSYYRLKQTDYDGTYTYSDALLINTNNPSNEISIYPIPASSYVHVNTSLPETEIEVYDIQGIKFDLPIEKSVSSFKIDVSKLNSGIYYIQIISLGSVRTSKVIVQ